MNIIDVLILVYIISVCFGGFKRGFIKTLFDTIGIIISFFISKNICYIVENFLMNNTKLFIKIYDFFEKQMSSFSDLFTYGEDSIHYVSETFKIPTDLQNILLNFVNSSTNQNINSFDMFISNLSIIIIRSVSFVITFLIIYCILVIISNIIDAIFKLPLLNITNKICGLIAGLVKSVVILYIIFALLTPIISFTQENIITQYVINSKSKTIFYDNNIILNYLTYKDFYEVEI